MVHGVELFPMERKAAMSRKLCWEHEVIKDAKGSDSSKSRSSAKVCMAPIMDEVLAIGGTSKKGLHPDGKMWRRIMGKKLPTALW